MRSASGGPRVLLRRLREIMAEQVSRPGAPGQDRGADRRQYGGRGLLDLCAARRQHAGTLRHRRPQPRRRPPDRADARMKAWSASSPARRRRSTCRDAQTHPAFSFRPETGEEIYHSFLGVPILRAGNTLGVLVVQNRAQRTYVEEEVEALQTTAMVLAEMIASGELSALAQPGAEPAARHPLHKTGAILSDGIALGHVVLHEPRVVITNYIAEDLPKEIKRLDAALAQAARRSRPHAGARRRRRRRRAPRRAGSLPHVRQRPRLVAQAARSGRHRPHRRSRGRTRAVRHPRAHAALDRSLFARPPARSRGSRPSPDAATGGPRSRAVTRAVARQRHPDRARDGPRRAARLRPQAPARTGAGGRHRQFARLDRGARARHSRGRRNRERAGHCRSRRRHHRRRHLGLDLHPPVRRKSNRPMPSGCGFAPGGRRNIARCATSPASPRTASRSN